MTGTLLIRQINDTQVPDGECVFWWVGQHGFIVKLGETVIYIDAYLSESDARNVPPQLNPMEVTNANIVIGTHDHGDHIDRPTWPVIAESSPNAIFLTPKWGRVELLEGLGVPESRVLGIDAGETIVHSDVRITAVPAAHEHLSQEPGTDFHEFLGVVIEGNGFCLYHAGDTCIYEGMQSILRKWKFNLAFLPINGRDAKRLSSGCIGNMTYQEAVDLAGTLQPGLVVPTHFEMFDGNTENPQLFMDYIAVKYSAVAAIVPEHGVLTRVGAWSATVSKL